MTDASADASAGMSGDGPHDLEDVITELRDQVRDCQTVNIRDVLDAFESRLFGPLLLAPGLIAISPVGAIPTAPTMLGWLILLIASQRLLGLRHPWLPDWLAQRSVSQSRLDRALAMVLPWARRVDMLIHPRWRPIVEGPMQFVLAAVACLVGLLMMPLELVPFAVYIPAAGIVALGLAMTAKDGVLGVLGLLLAAGAVGLAAWGLL